MARTRKAALLPPAFHWKGKRRELGRWLLHLSIFFGWSKRCKLGRLFFCRPAFLWKSKKYGLGCRFAFLRRGKRREFGGRFFYCLTFLRHRKRHRLGYRLFRRFTFFGEGKRHKPGRGFLRRFRSLLSGKNGFAFLRRFFGGYLGSKRGNTRPGRQGFFGCRRSWRRLRFRGLRRRRPGRQPIEMFQHHRRIGNFVRRRCIDGGKGKIRV